MNSVRYLLDSGVLIQAHRFHYRFDFCAGFWDWIVAAHESGLVYSLKKVQHEILEGGKTDLLELWIKQLPVGFFLNESADTNMFACYRELMQYVQSSLHYKPGAKSKFAGQIRADAFLVAYAKANGFVIVTQEKADPQRSGEVKIPDIAKSQGIESIDTFQLLSRHAESTFRFVAQRKTGQA
jgi:hypothetical protein